MIHQSDASMEGAYMSHAARLMALFGIVSSVVAILKKLKQKQPAHKVQSEYLKTPSY